MTLTADFSQPKMNTSGRIPFFDRIVQVVRDVVKRVRTFVVSIFNR